MLLLAAALIARFDAAPATTAQAAAVNAATARVFTLMGDGRAALGKFGDVPAATELDVSADRVAATPDGGFVVIAEHRLLRVTLDGRVHRLATAGHRIADVTAGPDGALYLLNEQGSTVLRLGSDGRLARFAGRPQPDFDCRTGGDGRPAADAQICAVRLAMSSSGLLLLARNPPAVRRIGPDGVITRIAGDGGSGPPTDGTPATASRLDAGDDDDIAAMPDGSPALLTASGIWTIGPDARMHRLLRIGRFGDWYRAIAPLGDGTVLTGGGRVGLLGPAGLRWLTTDPECCGLWSAFDGDAGPLSSAHWIQPLDIALDADGGWLIPEPGRLLYVAPPAPRRLAVGLARPTVSSRLPITATVETTRPARITVTVRIHGRRVGAATVERPAGRWRVPVAGGRTGVLNVVSVLAVGADRPGQVATDRIGVVPGGTLPMAVSRRLANGDAEDMRAIGGGDPTVRCKRMDRHRVDCADEDFDLCQEVTAYRLRPDGILTGRDYEAGGERCRFTMHPRWEDASPYGVELPSD